MTPTTEDLAKQVAQAARPTPVSRYELPAPPRPRDYDPPDDEDDEEDSERDYDPDEDRSVDSNDPPDHGGF